MRALTLPLLLLVACHPKPSETGDTGTPVAPGPWPDWAWTHWVWEGESTQESALALVDGYLEHDIPVGAIIIDSPWETGYNTFEWDPALFPDPQGMVDELHGKGVRVFVWIVGGINTDVPDLYAEGAEAGWFLQYDADSGPATVDWWKGEGSLVDFFNPDAVAWWQGLMDRTLDLGIDGWKVDGLDYYSALASWSPHLGADVSRIDYSHAYYRAFHDYTRERLGDDRLLTSRPVDTYGLTPEDPGAAAFTPLDIAWASWVGDQDATFVGLEAALLNMRYSSELGYLAFGSDIGGYREDDTQPNDRTKEVFLRWAQLGALCPVMENGGGGEHRPWTFDEETTSIYRSFVLLHHALLPYLDTEGAKAFAEGRSLMTFTSDVTYTYLLGPDVFVAPFLEEGTQIEVRFPEEGEWRWLFDSEQTFEAGATATLEVPYDALSLIHI